MEVLAGQAADVRLETRAFIPAWEEFRYASGKVERPGGPWAT